MSELNKMSFEDIRSLIVAINVSEKGLEYKKLGHQELGG